MVGSTGGGPRGKPAGAVSDAGLIGSGLFASGTIACAVTGPTNSLIELNVASEVIEESAELGNCPERTLKKHIDNILKQFDMTAGGIVLHANGCAGVYFTAPCMPYAVIKDQWIVYGWDINNRHYKKYPDDVDDLCRCINCDIYD